MEVNPAKQNINQLFSTTTYHIDFYQREYKWTTEQVSTLLDDIFYQFDQSYAQYPHLDASEHTVTAKYGWYYLNTYITNKTEGRIFIVDGQQGLTTLTLMLLVLYRMCVEREEPLAELADWLKTRIVGVGVGGKKQFWMAHSRRELLMQALFNGNVPDESLVQGSITMRYMSENYLFIRKQLGSRVSTQHKLETFIYYFLCMVVIINLEVAQTDVPMVFEVINDRGVRLRPYEILKGKLLGEIDKSEVDKYADVWETSLRLLEQRPEGEVDTFFRTYLRGRYADTRTQGQAFDGQYHRAIFQEPWSAIFALKSSPKAVKDFLKGPFKYYSHLYNKVRALGEQEAGPVPECYYLSQLTRMDGHVMLTLAACNIEDAEEDQKISAIARAFDRAYVMLQLNRAYDSNQFQEFLYTLHSPLHICAAQDIEGLINAKVLSEINRWKNTASQELLSYRQFQQVGYGDFNSTFLRYFLARIELFINQGIGWNSQDSLYNYVRGTGKANAYHVEHILSKNSESRNLFLTLEGKPDEQLFESERNRFGALLLLRGADNQAAGNEKYAAKLKTYNAGAPTLARTLVPDFYKANFKLQTFIEQSQLPFAAAPVFTRETLEKRSELLFAIVKKIWLM